MAAASALLVVACTGASVERLTPDADVVPTPPNTDVPDELAVNIVIQKLRGIEAITSRIYIARSLDEMLPNVAHRYNDGREVPGSELAVVGHVTDVVKGFSFAQVAVLTGEAPPAPFGFDAPGAAWATIHVKLAVDHALGAHRAPSEIRIGPAMGPAADFDAIAGGPQDLGDLVLLLGIGSSVSAYDPSLYSLSGTDSFS